LAQWLLENRTPEHTLPHHTVLTSEPEKTPGDRRRVTPSQNNKNQSCHAKTLQTQQLSEPTGQRVRFTQAPSGSAFPVNQCDPRNPINPRANPTSVQDRNSRQVKGRVKKGTPANSSDPTREAEGFPSERGPDAMLETLDEERNRQSCADQKGGGGEGVQDRNPKEPTDAMLSTKCNKPYRT
jgi:hypothetical protein